jgi:hypothetical protein
MTQIPAHRPSHALIHVAGCALSLVAGAALLWGTPAASAQDALGAGNALDGNLNVQGRTNPRAADIQDTISAANAIVTGNAARGRGFRGDLDYSASGDFRADLGSDALFSFRNDSFFSGLAGQGIRGTEAIQFQSSLLTSSAPSVGMLRSTVLDRPFSNTQADNLRPVTAQFNDTSMSLAADQRGVLPDFDSSMTTGQLQGMLDESGAALWSLRSASAYSSMSPLNPALIATLDDSDGRQVGITSSSLRGLRAEVLGEQRVNTSLSTRADTRSQTFQLPSEDADGAVADGSNSARNQRNDTPRAYLDLLNRLQEAGEARESETNESTGSEPANSTSGEDATDGDARSRTERPAWQQDIAKLRETITRSYTNRWTEGDRLRTPEERTVIDGDTLDLIERARGRTDSFRVPVDRDSLYAGHLAAAEALLRDRRYFDAEHRFTRALSVRPDNAVAQIGRIHAQMGATMAWSASNNLRALMSKQPEIIAERYGPNLLPDPAHIADLVDVLSASLGSWDADPSDEPDADRPANSVDQRSRAFMLAYVGYQYQRPAELAKGIACLDALARDAIATGDSSAEGDLMLANLVRRVWVIDDE